MAYQLIDLPQEMIEEILIRADQVDAHHLVLTCHAFYDTFREWASIVRWRVPHYEPGVYQPMIQIIWIRSARRIRDAIPQIQKHLRKNQYLLPGCTHAHPMSDLEMIRQIPGLSAPQRGIALHWGKPSSHLVKFMGHPQAPLWVHEIYDEIMKPFWDSSIVSFSRESMKYGICPELAYIRTKHSHTVRRNKRS